MSDLVLQLKQINKYFGQSHVIKDVNIDFERGILLHSSGRQAAGRPRFSAWWQVSMSRMTGKYFSTANESKGFLLTAEIRPWYFRNMPSFRI